MSKTEIVRTAYTALGRRFLADERIVKCLESWKNLPSDMPIRAINDGTLDQDQIDRVSTEFGIECVTQEEINDRVLPRLAGLDKVKHYLSVIKHFKKAVYTPLLAEDDDMCLLLDSDVLVKRPVEFPSDSPDILICCDDVPAYRLHYTAPFRIPLVPCINSGFVYFNPKSVQPSYLDEAFERASVKSINNWWVEQASWSIYAGNAKSKGLFIGSDACVVAGIGKRTPEQVFSNRFVWFRKSKEDTPETIQKLIEEASILHFAGPGKPWIDAVNGHQNTYADRLTLRWQTLANCTFKEKLLLSSRLLAIQTKERFGS